MIFHGCTLCGCLECPRNITCSRLPQTLTDFFPCPACGCLGTWRFQKHNLELTRTIVNPFNNTSYQQSIRESEEKREINKQMNVGAYAQSGNEQNPILSAKEVGTSISLKILAVKEIKSKKGFHGLVMEVYSSHLGKRVHFESFEPGFGISAAVSQLGSEETDEWIGEQLKFITKKGSKGNKKFVNIAFARAKKVTRRKRSKK